MPPAAASPLAKDDKRCAANQRSPNDAGVPLRFQDELDGVLEAAALSCLVVTVVARVLVQPPPVDDDLLGHRLQISQAAVRFHRAVALVLTWQTDEDADEVTVWLLWFRLRCVLCD